MARRIPEDQNLGHGLSHVQMEMGKKLKQGAEGKMETKLSLEPFSSKSHNIVSHAKHIVNHKGTISKTKLFR